MKPLTQISLAALMTVGLTTAAVAAKPSAATADYLAKAGASDLYEKTSSQLVLKSSKNAEVRKHANHMITDHAKSTAQVKAAARAAGITPKPPMLMAKQKSDVAALRAASGDARDRLYVEQQRAAHQEALAVHQGYSRSGDTPSLKAAATQIVPVVQSHIEMFARTNP